MCAGYSSFMRRGGFLLFFFQRAFFFQSIQNPKLNICLGRKFGLLLPTKIVLLRVITMLSSSLAGTKVTAATRVQTVKRNTTVRAATQKMGAKGKKRGGKVRVALSFYFVMENCAPQISLFRFEGGERYLGPICLDQERERDSTLASFLSVSAKAPQSLDSLSRDVVKNRFIGGTLFVRAVSYRSSNKEGERSVCVCVSLGALFFSKEEEAPPKATLFSSFFS